MDRSEIKRKKIENKFNDPGYAKMLSDIADEIARGIDSCINEATVADLFERTIYHHVRKEFELQDEEVRTKREVSSSDGAITDHFVGRMDSLYNNSFIIEYKHSSKLQSDVDKEKADNQIRNYMEQLHQEYMENHQVEDNIVNGILTDGKKVKFFNYLSGKLIETPFRGISKETLDIIIRSIVLKSSKPFMADNIVEDFSVTRGETAARNLAQVFFDALKRENVNEGTLLLMKEWEVLFHLSDNDVGQSNDIVLRRKSLSDIFGIQFASKDSDEARREDNDKEYRALYALQSVFAVIVKIISARIISRMVYDKRIIFFDDLTNCNSEKLRNFMYSLENGYNISLMGINNLTEGDYFSWYCTEGQWNNDIYKGILRVIDTLEEYAFLDNGFSLNAVDIFRKLYMEVMPNAVRHSLGEYFTPAWLADDVITKSITHIPAQWRGIDPCCGSGVFLVMMIRHIIKEVDVSAMKESEKKELLYEILDRVKGIDINPISTLMSRVSYCIAILPLLKSLEDVPKNIEIPVYLGDSSNPCSVANVGNIKCYEVNILIHDGDILCVKFPCAFVDDAAFESTMRKIELLSSNASQVSITNALKQAIGNDYLNALINEGIENLASTIVRMRDDSISVNWLRIIHNYFCVSRIKEIDLIVGNPPWVKWEHLPQKYAKKIQGQCVEKHLFSGQYYMGAIQLNICALIADMTAANWLTKSGILSFLMPKTMLTQDSYEGFRNFYLDYESGERLYLQKVDDWSNAGNPFVYTTEDFATYFYNRTVVDYNKIGVPVSFLKKKRGVSIDIINELKSVDDAKADFSVSSGRAYQLDTDRTGFSILEGDTNRDIVNIIGRCDYKARTGVEFTPSEVYWLKFVGAGQNGYAVFINNTLQKARHKATTSSAPFRLETKYIYPLVQGPSITKYKLEESNTYCIFPYAYNDGNCSVVSSDILVDECVELYDYLTKNQEVIGSQSKRSIAMRRGKEFYSLSKVGPYTFAPYIVAFRDNTKMAAVVLDPKTTDWSERKQYICAKHAAFFSVDEDDNYLSEDEAYYIAAIMNTEAVEKYFKATYSGRSYSIRNINVYIPKYHPENKIQSELAELSKMASNEWNELKFRKHVLDIELLYQKLCQNK